MVAVRANCYWHMRSPRSDRFRALIPNRSTPSRRLAGATALGRRRSILYRAEIGRSGWESRPWAVKLGAPTAARSRDHDIRARVHRGLPPWKVRESTTSGASQGQLTTV